MTSKYNKENKLNQEDTEKTLHLSTDRHFFDPVLAAQIGVHEAILVQHFMHWIRINKKAKRHFINGRTWTYQTMEEISNHFDYLSKKQIEKLLNKLIKIEKILIKDNFNKSKFDRTAWYAFKNEEFINHQIDMAKPPNREEMHFPKKGNGNLQKGTPIPDNKTRYINKEKEIYKEKTADKSAIEPKGSPTKKYEIKISKEEEEKLLKIMTSKDLEFWKDQLLSFLEMKGKPNYYKCHYAAIRNWFKKEEKKKESYKYYKNKISDTAEEEKRKVMIGFEKYKGWRERIEGSDPYYANQPSFYIKNNKFVIYGKENFEYNITLENLKKLVIRCNSAPYIIAYIEEL